jgi:hypothetical protein
MDEEVEDVTRLLPGDALAAVLTHLGSRGLAACRHICKAWRAVVDTHRLLRMDLLPLSVDGVYLNVSYLEFPPLFHRPSPGPAVAIRDDLDYLVTGTATNDYDVRSTWSIIGHCNGLPLLENSTYIQTRFLICTGYFCHRYK